MEKKNSMSGAVSSVRVNLSKKGKVKAMVTVTLFDLVVVTGIRVVEGEKGLFLGMPQRKEGEGSYKDVVYPLDQTAREGLTAAVLEAYEVKAKEGKKD